MRVRDGAPVLTEWLEVWPLPRHQLDEPLRFFQVRRLGPVAQQQLADAFETETVVDQREDVRFLLQVLEIELAMEVPELLAGERITRVVVQRPSEGNER